MDFDRTCIIKVPIAALETPVLKPILSANVKECFFGSEAYNSNSPRREFASPDKTLSNTAFQGTTLSPAK